jgi:hypothetical protein
MNERFKELAQEARLLTGWPVGEVEYQKFAELIVRECITVMYNNAIERQVSPDIEKTPTYYAVAILEHFGVEE